MEPVSPVLAPEFVANEIVYAKDQPQYTPLPTLRSPDGVVMSRWKFTDQEREAIAAGADVLLSICTFNGSLQPLYVEVAECDRDLMALARWMGLIKSEQSEPTSA